MLRLHSNNGESVSPSLAVVQLSRTPPSFGKWTFGVVHPEGIENAIAVWADAVDIFDVRMGLIIDSDIRRPIWTSMF